MYAQVEPAVEEAQNAVKGIRKQTLVEVRERWRGWSREE